MLIDQADLGNSSLRLPFQVTLVCVKLKIKVITTEAWKDDSLIRSTCCYWTGPGSIPSTHNGGSQPSVTTVPADPIISSGLHGGMPEVHIHICMQVHTHTHKIK